MYYSDISNSGSTLATKFTKDSSPFFSEMTQIPSFSNFDGQLTRLLPENMLRIVDGGIVEAFSKTLINQNIASSLNELTPEIGNNTISTFKSIIGDFPYNPQGAISIDQLDSTSKKISQINQDQAKKTSNQMVSIFNNNTQGSQLGNLNYALDSSLASSTKLSPKGVRDLNNPNNLITKASLATSKASNQLSNTSYSMVQEIASNKAFADSAQINLQQLSQPQFSGNNSDGFTLYVRRTVYWAYGPGTDIDSANLKSSTGRQLQEGISAAVDPSIIPYLSKIQFPDIGTRFATDTGGAVKARTASGGSTPIIDVFFLNKEDAIAFANSSPLYVTVKVIPPQTKYRYVANSSPTYGTA